MAPRYLIETFGCQMNVHDSSRMEEALRARGWEACTSEDDADLIVFNTCSVREKAEHKLRSEVGRLRPIKRARPELIVAVAGCVAQQEGERLLTEIPHIDIVVGPDNLADLPELAEAARLGGLPVARTVFDVESPTFLGADPGPHREGSPVTAFVTTMKGCDERCSFCVVPYTRGPERYRSMQEILEEIARLVAAGVQEVTLLGQTVNSWQPPETTTVKSIAGSAEPRPSFRGEASHFPELLRAIAREIPLLRRLRYTSPHPRHVTPELVAAHAELDVLARHVHLPSQSGSDRLLKRMLRRYTRAELVERSHMLRDSRPGTTLSTDIIVGFPGETEQDFLETLSMIREVGFIAAFGFKFSPRPYTPALKLADDVSEAEKAERLARLFSTVEALQQAHLLTLVGSRANVLVEGTSKPGGTKGRTDGLVPGRDGGPAHMRMMGRSERNEIVHLDLPPGLDGRMLVGRFLDVRIERANAHSLVGALDESTLRSLPALAEPPRQAVRLQVVAG